MLRWPFLAIALLCSAPASAQLTMTGVGGGGFGGAAAAYAGPGDVVAFSIWWGLRAYTLASAGTKSANVCNAADANCADVNTLANGNFDVATATGAPLNCGGAGGTCTVKTLYDKSGNTLCTTSVACDITQATIATRPTLVLNCLNTSLPCLGWTATQFLQSTALTTTINQTFSAYGVAQRTGGTTSFSDITSSGAPVQLGFSNAANNALLFAGNVASKASVNDSVFHNIIGVFAGAASTLYADGSSSTVDAGTGPISSSNSFCMGACNNGLIGQSTEAGWKAADLTTNLTALNSNVHSYWGF